MRRHLRPLLAEQVHSLPTARLLAYRNRMLELEDSIETSDIQGSELAVLDPTLIYFKSDTVSCFSTSR